MSLNRADRTLQLYKELYSFKSLPHVRIQRGGGGSGGPDPLINHKNIGFLSNSGPDPLKNYEATEPAFNVRPSSARQRNAI